MQQRVLTPSFKSAVGKFLDSVRSKLRYPENSNEDFFEAIESEVAYGFHPEIVQRNPVTGQIEHIQIFEIPMVCDKSLHLVVTPDDFMFVQYGRKEEAE
jgi:hypothetical protein